MIFYLAARPHRIEQLRAAEADLIALGHESSTGWIHNDDDTEVNGGAPLVYGSAQANRFAIKDLADIDRADVLINFTEERGSLQRGGGRFIEIGYALAKDMTVVTIGDIENLFLGLTNVYPEWAAYLARLQVQAGYACRCFVDESGDESQQLLGNGSGVS